MLQAVRDSSSDSSSSSSSAASSSSEDSSEEEERKKKAAKKVNENTFELCSDILPFNLFLGLQKKIKKDALKVPEKRIQNVVPFLSYINTIDSIGMSCVDYC